MGKPRDKNKNKTSVVRRKPEDEKEKEEPVSPVDGEDDDERKDDEPAGAAGAGAAPKAAAPAAPRPVAGQLAPGEGDYRSATGVLLSQKAARDVKIGSFTLIAHGKPLIADTTIELTIGRRYGLIGANGSGKSTFLKCLAAREVPIPEHIDIFYLETEAQPEEVSAIDAVVLDAERKMKALEDEAERLIGELGPEHELVTDIYSRLDEMDPKTFRARAGELLYGLGFSKEMMAKFTRDMSGGWRMRVALAQALFAKPTLLLLDEPTNHLDLGAVVWLENYLAQYNRCLVVVSHSQDFLNHVCTNIIHLTQLHTLVGYSGNYDQFVKTKAENEVNQLKRWKKEQDDIAHLKAFISSCGTYSNLVRQAKSKQKIIDKMVEAGLTEKPLADLVFNFQFPPVHELPPPLMSFETVSFAYSGRPEDYLYTKLDLAIPPDARIALVGPNGAGKSTLLKLMVGDLSPQVGQVRRHIDIKFGRYHQHSLEQLDPDLSPIQFCQKMYEERKWSEDEWRRHVGRYGVTGSMQVTPMGKLSDGQKSRMCFALIALENPNVLLLDEPTNHLDMEAIDALARAINGWNGALVLVSHDFRLIDQVAKELWVCDKKTVQTWPNGDIRGYKKHLLKEMKMNAWSE